MAGRGRAPPPGGGNRQKSNLRLTLKIKDSNKPRPTQSQIFEMTHTRLRCFLTGLNDLQNGGFTVFTDLPATIDQLTSDKGKEELAKLNLETATTPKLRAARTEFISGLPRHVGNRTADEIKTELKHSNPWLSDVTVYKIKDYYHIFKLTCNDSTETDRVLRDEPNAFHTRISQSQIKAEQFTELQICFNCYKYESHTSKQCPSKTIVCSECAQTGHTHYQCTSTIKRCLNCPPDNNNHRTLAASCPIKRRAIADKEKRLKDETEKQNNKTYSTIVKNTIKETIPAPRPTINLTDKTQLKMVALVIEAHIASIGDGRPYNEILSESLRLNYDIDVKLPNRDSQKILNVYLNPGQQKTDSTTDDSSDNEQSMDSIPAPTPCPSPLKPKDVRPKRQRTPEQTTSSKTQKQPRQETIKPAYGFRVFRSEKDPEKLPTTITADWTIDQITKRPEFGLRVHVYGDIDKFQYDLTNRLFAPSRDKIRFINDQTFQSFDKIAHYNK